MDITVYAMELDEERHPVLVAEDTVKYGGNNFDSPGKVAELCVSALRMHKMAEEQLFLLAEDSAGHPLGLFRVSHGEVNSTACNPREIYLRALAVGAVAIVLVHNHPSGNCTPSKTDLSVAMRIVKAGKLLGIAVSDFLIIGDGYYSFMEQGDMK